MRENFRRLKDASAEGLRPALRRHANNPMIPWPCIPEEKVRRGAGRSLPRTCAAQRLLLQIHFRKVHSNHPHDRLLTQSGWPGEEVRQKEPERSVRTL